MAAEQGVEVDEDGLPPADEGAARPGQGRRPGQEDRRTATPRAYRGVADALGRDVEFTGYDEVDLRGARSRGLLVDGESVASAPRRARRSSSSSTAPRSTPRAAASSPTPAGSSWTTAPSSRSRDVQSPVTGLIVHRATRARPARSASARPRTRSSTSTAAGRSRRAHTATHMVHKAIREALGDTATQAGSENSPGRFRFDFNAQSAVPASRAGRRRGRGQRAAARGPRRCTPRS